MSRIGIAAVGDADQTETTNVVSLWQRLSLRHFYAPAVWCPTTFDWHVLAFGILLLVACLFRGTQFWLSKPHCFSHLANSWFSLGRDAMFPCHLSVASETAYEASLNRKNSHLPARPLGAAVVSLNDRDWGFARRANVIRALRTSAGAPHSPCDKQQSSGTATQAEATAPQVALSRKSYP
jgi:hypothetical protein